jgi:HEPN domain-containing protein
MEEKINIKKVVDYWFDSAEDNYQTARYLLKGERYPDCLFFCHLMIEKILKALVVEGTKTHAPYIHKLVDLAKSAKIDLSSEQIENLTTITEFNIAARYDAVKYDFRKKATKEYAEKYFSISEQIYLWLKEKLCQQK